LLGAKQLGFHGQASYSPSAELGDPESDVVLAVEVLRDHDGDALLCPLGSKQVLAMMR